MVLNPFFFFLHTRLLDTAHFPPTSTAHSSAQILFSQSHTDWDTPRWSYLTSLGWPNLRVSMKRLKYLQPRLFVALPTVGENDLFHGYRVAQRRTETSLVSIPNTKVQQRLRTTSGVTRAAQIRTQTRYFSSISLTDSHTGEEEVFILP